MKKRHLFASKKLRYYYFTLCLMFFVFGVMNYIIMFYFKYIYNMFDPNIFTFITSLVSIIVGFIFIFVIYRIGQYYRNLYDFFLSSNHQSYLQEQTDLQDNFQYIEKQYYENIYQELKRLEKDDFHQRMLSLEEVIQTYKNTYSRNMIINSLLSYKFQTPQYQHISIYTNIHVPSKSFVSDIDLSALLFNLVDNALKGASQTTQPEIYLSMEEKYRCLKIHIHNSYIKNQTVLPRHHGYGIKIMKDIVEKYHGEMIITKNHHFDVMIYLYEEDGL